MSELLETYLSDPETFNHIARAATKVIVRRLVGLIFNLVERRLFHGDPRDLNNVRGRVR